MPIPEFDEATGYLPPGMYPASLEEVRVRYATNFRRKEIYAGLVHVVALLVAKSVSEIWLDGSFVTDKIRPKDVDVIYVPPPGADIQSWDLISPDKRETLKKYHQVDLWPYPSHQPVPGSLGTRKITIREFFE